MGEKWTADGLSLDRIQRIEREADEGFAREPEAKAWDTLERIGKQADEAYAQELETKPTADEGPSQEEVDGIRGALERATRANRTPWYDSDITPEVPQDQLGREFRAQQEPEPCGTVEQRAQAMREAESDDIKLNGVGLAILERRVAEQSTIIAGQRAAIEALRVWVQERADGVSNLGMRLSKHEDMHSGLGGVMAAWMRATNAQLHRLLWGHPALEQPTTSERQAVTRLESTITQCAASGPREEGDKSLLGRIKGWRELLETVRLDTIVNAELSNTNQDTCVDNGARIDKVSGIADRNALSVSESLSNILTRLDRLEAQADKCARFRAIHPPVTEEGNRD